MVRPVFAVATAALVACGCGHSATMPSSTTATAAPALTLPRVPPRDRFIGTLRDGTGSLAAARGVVEVRLEPVGTTGRRALTLWIVRTGCRPSAACVHLIGRLRGQLAPVRTLPDVGRRYAITASGSVRPVGAATAVGTVAGTGNIAFGSESLQLMLKARHGSARLSARSGRVPGFTSP
jgi:hypothetical protein